MRMNKEDEELVKMVNPTLKRRETILFFLIVVINGLKCIVSDIGLDTCARGRWRVEVSKLEMNGALGLNTLCRGFLAIKHFLGCCILGETSQRRSTPVTKGLNLLKESECRASVQKLCCVIPFFILIIFRSIIQILLVLFPLLLWLHQQF